MDRIANAAAEGNPESIVEIGPGKGALTESLLEAAGATEPPARIAAIEVDPVLVHYLQHKFREAIEGGRLELIEGDVLKVDLGALTAGGKTSIAGNLPYYITSPILERVFATSWQRGVFLVQAEVAARVAAAPGSRDYGYLSVLAQLHAAPRILCPVPRDAFRPPPKVDSAVIALDPRDAASEWGIADREAFLRFASMCFRQKRKTLRNNLAPLYGRERMDALEQGRLRAEQLSISELAELYRTLSSEGGAG